MRRCANFAQTRNWPGFSGTFLPFIRSFVTRIGFYPADWPAVQSRMDPAMRKITAKPAFMGAERTYEVRHLLK